MRRVTVALFVLLMAGCGGGDDKPAAAPTTGDARPGATATTPLDEEAAGEMLKAVMTYLSDGQTGRAYDLMHPAQQAIVPKALYMKCAGDDLAGIEISDIKVKETFTEKVDVPGTDLTNVDSVAATITFKGQQGNLDPEEATETFHAFLVDGQWRWTLSDAAAYAGGECPA